MNNYLIEPIIAVILVVGFGLAAWLVPKFTLREKESIK